MTGPVGSGPWKLSVPASMVPAPGYLSGPRLGHRAGRYLNCSRRRIGGSVGRVQSDAQAAPTTSRPQRLRRAWYARLGPGERSAVLAWASFALTFGSVRALTHWIRDGHGPAGGGMSLGGKHFHHYNLGIALLTGIGAVAIRGQEQHHRHPVTALSFGTATALIADEAALLLDLEDVYWAKLRTHQRRPRRRGDRDRRTGPRRGAPVAHRRTRTASLVVLQSAEILPRCLALSRSPRNQTTDDPVPPAPQHRIPSWC